MCCCHVANQAANRLQSSQGRWCQKPHELSVADSTLHAALHARVPGAALSLANI